MAKLTVTAPVADESGSHPLVRVKRSKVHGFGVFAKKPIKKGERIIEYIGDRVSHSEADERYAHRPPDDNHTFLFIVDNKTVIDAGSNGNDARFFNHCCDPNCESVIEDRRVFVEAIRDIAKGDEMTYDYQIGRDKDDPPNIDVIFACRCGSAKCRGTMLWPAKRPGKKKSSKGKAAVAKSAARKNSSKTSPGKKSKTSVGKKKKSAAKKKSAVKRAKKRTSR